MIRCFTASGSRYDMGVRVGQEFASYLQGKIGKYEELLGGAGEAAFVEELKRTIPAASAGCWDELRGRADGAGVSLDALLLMMSPEYFYKSEGCTTVYVKDGCGKVKFAHNEDNSGYNMDTVALVKYDSGDRWVVSYTMAERLGGCAFSWNSDGMIFSTNFISSSVLDLRRPSRYFLIRDVIESATLDEAVDAIRSAPTASPFSLNIVDTKTDRAANCEKDIDATYVKELEDRYCRANHFILKPTEKTEASVSSLFRQGKIRELVEPMDLTAVTSEDLVQALCYREDDIDRCIYKDFSTYDPQGKGSTVANFSYDNSTGELCFRDYISGDTVRWDWNGFANNI